MKKTNRAAQSDAKIQQLLIALMRNYTVTEFRPFDTNLYRDTYKVGASYHIALKELGAIETQHGKLKLTERLYTVRPSTVRKHMNNYVKNSVATRSSKIKTETTATTIYNIDVLKAQIREEVIQELLAKLK